MMQQIFLYAALAAIPLAGWLGYDYGVAKQSERQQESAADLTSRSVTLADAAAAQQEKVKIVYRDIVRTVELAHDPTQCLDARPCDVIADSVRQLQSRQR